MAMTIVTGYLWGLLAAGATLESNEFQSVQWETYYEPRAGISIDYPYDWTVRSGVLRDESFYASDATLLPSVSIAVHPLPADADLVSLDAKAVAQFGAAGRMVKVEEGDIDGVPVRVIDVNWGLPLGSGLALRSRVVSMLRGPNWVLIRASDGIPVDGALLGLLQSSLDSIRLDANWSAAP